ncbi:hypothetical protein [Actinopolymorpha rutila]|uniref:Uncharacterized protein n=1 Tax=Actinopolymorpha rutila TaxID=446787 RepID=A0A852ZMP8_9ACTN|nr:hypothetical protein [Actinopolymorpha rutila]NYH92832.1 hypothetical protein [Actinopolymorpha rutila]
MSTILPSGDANPRRGGVDFAQPSELLDRAAAAIDASLYVRRVSFGITDEQRRRAAEMLAAFWATAEEFDVTRDDLRGALDLPTACIALAATVQRRAANRAEIARRGGGDDPDAILDRLICGR